MTRLLGLGLLETVCDSLVLHLTLLPGEKPGRALPQAFSWLFVRGEARQVHLPAADGSWRKSRGCGGLVVHAAGFPGRCHASACKS